MTATPAGGTSPFLPTMRNWDIPDDQLRIQLSQYLNNVAYSVNIRAMGNFETLEMLTAQQFTDPTTALLKRQEFRKIFYWTGTSPIAITHDITGVVLYTHIYGTATDGTLWYPLPNDNIDVTVSSTVITITSSGPVITSGLMVLEYVKT
jgi:hypothetical protein